MPSARSEASLAVITSRPLFPRANDWSNTMTKANPSHLPAMDAKVVCPRPGLERMPVSGSTNKAAGNLGEDAPGSRVPRKRQNVSR